MAKITQYSRISHHTLAGSASATFSIPPSEDFTDGSWNVNGTQLALSEIGVNEDAQKAYIRIGSDIKEFSFDPGLIGPTGPTGAAGGTQSLEDTLAIGNISGANNIVFTDSYGLYNNTSEAYITFDSKPNISYGVDNGTSSTLITHTYDSYVLNLSEGDNTTYIYAEKDLIEIKSDIDSLTASLFQLKPDYIILQSSDDTGYNNSQITSSHSGISMVVSDSLYGSTNSFYMNKDVMNLRHDNDNDEWYSELSFDGTSPQSQLSTGYNSNSLLGRVRTGPGSVDIYSGNGTVSNYISTTQNNTSFRVLHVDNGVEKSDIKVGKDIDNNYRVSINRTNFAFGTASTTTSASASVFSLSLPDAGDHSWVKAQVKAITSTFSKSYVADIFGGFRNDGSLNLVGSGYAVFEYTDFTGGARADYDISGTNMLIKVYGETSSTINWSVNVTWG